MQSLHQYLRTFRLSSYSNLVRTPQGRAHTRSPDSELGEFFTERGHQLSCTAFGLVFLVAREKTSSMFPRLVRAVEPFLKVFSHRVVSPWKGNHIEYSDLRRSIIPWGFVSQAKVLESVKPHRAEGTMEKRAEDLNLDTWEFLRGTEEAYRCVARLFAPDSASASVSQQEIAGGGGVRDDRHVGSAAVGTALGHYGEAFGGKPEEQPSLVGATNFLDLDVASPEMSMFLNDVLESYNLKGLVPRLSISSVKATLCNVGIRLGGISKNTNFLGLISADEVKYHLTMGMLGPEGAVINEMEGRAPQKIIADVMLTCEEDFVLEDATGTVVHRDSSEGPKVHYLTLQSNIGEGKKLQWQVTNINDVIKPNLAYYFARFGH